MKELLEVLPSDSIKAMVTLESAKILTLIYCFSKNENLEEVLEKSLNIWKNNTKQKI